MAKCDRIMLRKVLPWLVFSRKHLRAEFLKTFHKSAHGQAGVIVESVDWQMVQDEGEKALKAGYFDIFRYTGEGVFSVDRVQMALDVYNPRALEWAKRNAAKDVRFILKSSKMTIHNAITASIESGASTRQTMKAISDVILLTPNQARALAKFKAELLDRPKLAAAQVDKRVSRYHDRLLRRRSEMIVRTESSAAYNEGLIESHLQLGTKQLDFLANANACRICIPLDGSTYSIDAARGVIPVHPNCRCSWVRRRKSSRTAARPTMFKEPPTTTALKPPTSTTATKKPKKKPAGKAPRQAKPTPKRPSPALADTVDTKTDKLQRRLDRLKEDSKEQNKKIVELSDDIKGLKSELSDAEKINLARKTEVGQLQADLAAERKKFRAAEAKIRAEEKRE